MGSFYLAHEKGWGWWVQDLCPVTSLLPVYDSSYFLIFLRKGGEGEGEGGPSLWTPF